MNFQTMAAAIRDVVAISKKTQLNPTGVSPTNKLIFTLESVTCMLRGEVDGRIRIQNHLANNPYPKV